MPTLLDSQTRQTGSAYKWAVVAMLWLICFLNYADRQSIYSVFPKFEQEFGFGKFQQGLIGSAFMWVYALAAPFAGFVGDRVRRKDLILGGCIVWSLITVMTGWCTQLWQFVTVRALEGLGETFYFPASMSLVSDYHDRRTRSRAMSIHQSSVYAGTIGGSWAGAWFAQEYGWRVGFYIFGALGILVAMILYLFLREPPRAVEGREDSRPDPDAPGVGATLAAIFRSPAAVVLMMVFLGANFVATIFLTWTPSFLVEKFHYKLAAAGLSGAVYIHLASSLSAPLGGLAADSLAKRFASGRIMVQAAGLLLGAAFVFSIGITGAVGTLILSMIGFGLCKGLYDSNIFASMYDTIDPRVRATAAGVLNTVGWGGGALGPLYVGWMAEHGPRATIAENMGYAISLAGFVYIACGVLMLIAIAFLVKPAKQAAA